MGACIADSLAVKGNWSSEETDFLDGFSGKDIRSRFCNWIVNGYNNAFLHSTKRDPNRSVGLGGNIGKSLKAILDLKYADIPDFYESSSQDSGNGGLMRLAAVPIYYSGGGHREVHALCTAVQ